MRHKILFTSPCGPYPKLPVDKDPIDYFYYRNTYKQKMFQLRAYQSWHSLHFIAQNIAVGSVVLENSSMKTFQKELSKGKYEIIAIGFTILLTKRVLEMVEWVKQNYPDTEVVLGGYGTAVFKESFETSDRLKKLTDHICYGEGVQFFNDLILNKWGIGSKKELRQDLLPSINCFYRTHIEIFRQIVIVGGLGCVYGCSFCATSSQFSRRYIPLFTGQRLFESLIEQARKHPKIQSAIIYEEDFLRNKPLVEKFKELFRNSELSERPFLLTVFASLRSLSNYSIEELIECGIGTIFIGVESFDDQVLELEGLVKRKGGVSKVFDELHLHGINTLGSLIIGWDNHTAESVNTDCERFISLNPTFYQVVPLHAVPGTKLWEKMKLQNRISSDYMVEADGITNFNFDTKHFNRKDAIKYVFLTYDGLVKEGGPWPFRLFENLLHGYLNLKEKPGKIFYQRAKMYQSMMFPICLLAFSSRFFFYGKNFRKKWSSSMIKFRSAFPYLFGLSVIFCPVIVTVLSGIYLFGNFTFMLKPKGDQPDYVRSEY